MTSAVVVGSGPNGLAAALTLAAEGIEVTVLEASDRLGGGARSSELTLPGLIHDECAAAHPLAIDNPFSRRFDLAGHGLTWRWPLVQYAHPLDGGAGAAAWRSVDETAAGLGRRDGRRRHSHPAFFRCHKVGPKRLALRRRYRHTGCKHTPGLRQHALENCRYWRGTAPMANRSVLGGRRTVGAKPLHGATARNNI